MWFITSTALLKELHWFIKLLLSFTDAPKRRNAGVSTVLDSLGNESWWMLTSFHFSVGLFIPLQSLLKDFCMKHRTVCGCNSQKWQADEWLISTQVTGRVDWGSKLHPGTWNISTYINKSEQCVQRDSHSNGANSEPKEIAPCMIGSVLSLKYADSHNGNCVIVLNSQCKVQAWLCTIFFKNFVCTRYAVLHVCIYIYIYICVAFKRRLPKTLSQINKSYQLDLIILWSSGRGSSL